MKSKLGIICVLLAALFLRLYHLDTLPASLFGDEIDASYQAWSLASTLRDYRGHFLPTYVQSLSEWRAPLEMYFIAPFLGLLGPSSLAARLPMALAGVASIYLIYLIVNRLFPKKSQAGLIAAAILTLTPWHLHYTRNVVEQPPLFLLVLLGVYFYLKAKDRLIYYPLSLFFFILTFYTYSIANLATPFIILILFICFPTKLKSLLQSKTLIGFFICFLAVIPITYQIFFGPAAGRFKLISIFNDKAMIDQIFSDRSRPWISNHFLENIYNNRPVAIFGQFLNNYFTSLSPQFFFLSGDPIYRQSVDHYGVFLVSLAPLFIFGLVVIFKNLKNRAHLLLLAWLLLIPLGSSLTQGGGNHASRLFLLNFPFAAITAVGLVEFLNFIQLKYRLAVTAAIFLFVTLNFSAYWYRYTTHYAYESSHVWQYGYEPLFVQSRQIIAKANRVFINNTAEPALYRFAFYYPITPKDFQRWFTTDRPTKDIVPGFDGFLFGSKFYFGTAGNLDGISKILTPGDVYLAAQKTDIPGDWDLEKNPPDGLKVLVTIRDFYLRPLFYVLSR